MDMAFSHGLMVEFTREISSWIRNKVKELLLGPTDANMKEDGLVENNMEMASILTMR